MAVAFDAGNLVHVAKAIRKAHPAALLVICGDDDTATEAKTGTNPGRVKAQEAARAVRGVCVWPEGLADGGSDFNDLHQSAGLDAVRELIEAAIECGPQSARKRTQAPATHPGPENAPAGRDRAARGRSDEAEGDAPRVDWFRVDDGGLWFDPPDDGSGGASRPLKICGPLHVAALARDVRDTGAALLLEFDTRFRAGRRWLMPLSMLAGDGTAYRAELLNHGFMVPTDSKRRAHLTAYLQSRKPAELVRIVDRVGWHDAAGGAKVYVLPRETLGDDGGERVMFQSEAPTDGTFGQRGTLDQWRERIGRLCVGNSRLTFAASCAFAGPMLAWAADTDGRGVHLVGDSRSGKTAALRVAASIWGGRDYMQRWRASDNGLEGIATQHSDGVLCLDELAQLDAKVAGESCYMLSNGSGKIRGQRSGVGSRAVLTWRILFLSTGEIGLADHMAEANKRTRAGQELRMIDLPADAGAGYGVFEELHGHESGGTLADALRLDVLRTYGTPGRAWLEHLTSNTEGLSHKLRERMAAIESAIVPDAASGQVRDAGRFFALVAAAGEMATADANLTGWPEGAAIEAARRCFNAWIAARTGGIGLSEDAQILRQVREWFGTYGEMNFKRWGVTDSDHAPAVPMMTGWRKPDYGDDHNTTGDRVQVEVGRTWYTLADKFRSTVCKGLPYRRALDLLKARDLLILEPSGRALHRARPPGETEHGADVYRIKSAILSASDEE